MDLFQRQRARLVGVVNVVTVVVQVLDDIPVKQQSVEGDVLVGQQRFTGQFQCRKHGVCLSHAADLVPIEDAVRGKVKIKFHLRVPLRPACRNRQIFGGVRQQAVPGHRLRRDVRPGIFLQGGHVVPPDGIHPRKSLVQRFALVPALGHQGVEAVIEHVLIQQVFHVIDGTGVIEIIGHCTGNAVRRPGENIGIHGEQHPLGRVGPHQQAHHLIEFTEIAVRNGEPQARAAENSLKLAAVAVGGHGGAKQHHVRRVVADDTRRLVAFAEENRLPVRRHPVVKAGVYLVDNGGAGRQHKHKPQKQAPGPFLIGALFHGGASFL